MKKVIITAILSLLAFQSFARTDYHYYREKYSPNIFKDDIVDVSFFNKFGFGFSNMIPDDGIMSMSMGKSFEFSMDMIALDVALNRSGSLCFHTALSWSFENYVSDKNLYFTNVGDAIVGYPNSDCKKSKMRADYLGIPLGLAFNHGDLKIYANIMGEMLTTSISKFKGYETGKHKERISGFNQLGASAEIGAAYDLVGFFVKYRITPSFKSSAEVGDRNVITVGITLNL